MDRGEPKWFAFEIVIFKNQITSLEGAGTAAAPGKGPGAQDTQNQEGGEHMLSSGGAASVDYSENHFLSHIYPNHTHNCKRK